VSSGIGQHENDKRWMRAALAEARKAEGRTGTNPPVGCVLISPDNKLIAAGHTKPNGRPHAEAVALAEAGSAGLAHRVVGGTAYVTLEPCAHHGKTPPCAEALRDAGIARLVYALNDPDERVNGKGIACLRAASVEIASEFMTEFALDITSGFIYNKLKNRPFFTSKIATSEDGFIAKAAGEQYWLTGDVSRRFVHDLRSRVDAVLTGSGTVLADNPQMTCRVPGIGHQPHRIILDSSARVPLSSHLVRDASDIPVLIIHGDAADRTRLSALAACGVELIHCRGDGSIKLDWLAGILASRGYQHVLIEAGTILNTAFLHAGLTDRIYWLKSPEILGEGVSSVMSKIANAGINSDATMDFGPTATYVRTRSAILGGDNLSCWQSDSLITRHSAPDKEER